MSTKHACALPVIEVAKEQLDIALADEKTLKVIQEVTCQYEFPSLQKCVGAFTIKAALIKLPSSTRFSIRVLLEWKNASGYFPSLFTRIRAGMIGYKVTSNPPDKYHAVGYSLSNCVRDKTFDLCKFRVDSYSRGEGYITDIGTKEKLVKYADDWHKGSLKFCVYVCQPKVSPFGKGDTFYNLSTVTNSTEDSIRKRKEQDEDIFFSLLAPPVDRKNDSSSSSSSSSSSNIDDYLKNGVPMEPLSKGSFLRPFVNNNNDNANSGSNSRDNKDNLSVNRYVDNDEDDDDDVEEVDAQFVPKRQRPISDFALRYKIKDQCMTINKLHLQLKEEKEEHERTKSKLRGADKFTSFLVDENSGLEKRATTFTSMIAELNKDKESLQNEVKKYKEIADAAQSGVCKVCTDAAVQVMMHPCCHIFACEKCANRLSVCSICRGRINGFHRVYFS